MNKTTECDRNRISQFINRSISSVEQEELESHLNECEDCRKYLHDEVAAPSLWTKAVESLRPEIFFRPPGDEESQQLLSEGVQRVIDSLAPTDDPAMLGRISCYEISGVVGTGGMGVVLKGIDPSLNRVVAIKVLAPHLAASRVARNRFAREARAAAAITHLNVIDIYSVSESQGLPYFVMPYSKGPNLQSRIDDGSPLTTIEIVRIGKQLADGLAAAHAQGLVHRDIKPANILLSDGIERLTITDFGLARAVDDASVTRTGIIAGTPQYMSPEQSQGNAVDYRSDLFSLGSVLYTMCTGRPPFLGSTTFGTLRRIADDKPPSIRELNPEVPEWLESLISKLHAKEPSNRFESARQIAQLLERCLAHLQSPTTNPLPECLCSIKQNWLPNPVTRLIRSRKRNPLAGSNRPATISFFTKKGLLIMFMILGFTLLGFVAMTDSPPDISGTWHSEQWGEIVVDQEDPTRPKAKFSFLAPKFRNVSHPKVGGKLDGALLGGESIKGCAKCHDDSEDMIINGTIDLRWSRLENRFNGSWRENESHFGRLSLRLTDRELKGGWTSAGNAVNDEVHPRLGDITWLRIGSSNKEVDASKEKLSKNPAISDSKLFNQEGLLVSDVIQLVELAPAAAVMIGENLFKSESDPPKYHADEARARVVIIGSEQQIKLFKKRINEIDTDLQDRRTQANTENTNPSSSTSPNALKQVNNSKNTHSLNKPKEESGTVDEHSRSLIVDSFELNELHPTSAVMIGNKLFGSIKGIRPTFRAEPEDRRVIIIGSKQQIQLFKQKIVSIENDLHDRKTLEEARRKEMAKSTESRSPYQGQDSNEAHSLDQPKIKSASIGQHSKSSFVDSIELKSLLPSSAVTIGNRMFAFSKDRPSFRIEKENRRVVIEGSREQIQRFKQTIFRIENNNLGKQLEKADQNEQESKKLKQNNAAEQPRPLSSAKKSTKKWPPSSTAEAVYKELLEADHWKRRAAAARALGARGESGLKLLIRGTKHDNADVRDASFDELHRRFKTNGSTIEVSLRALLDPDRRIQVRCISFVGSQKIKQAKERLWTAYRDPVVRLNAACSLAKLGESSVLQVLYDAAGSNRYRERMLANAGLKALSGRDLEDFPNETNKYRWHENAMVSGGIEARTLRKPIQDADVKSRRYQALNVWCRWLKSENPELFLTLTPHSYQSK